VRLHLHAARFETDEGMGGRTSEHSSTVESNVVRVVSGFVSKGATKAADAAPMDAHDLEGHIETGEAWPRREPLCSSASETPALLGVHHLDGLAEVHSRTHLHLAEDEVRAASDDQVDLASADAHVHPKDLVSAEEVVDRGAPLGRPTGG
jgi:hypothetical protein